EDYGSGLRVRFECMTFLSDAMLQVIEPGYHMEHLYLGAVPISASLKAVIRRSVLNVGTGSRVRMSSWKSCCCTGESS
ncbi:hypothetical protein ACC684_39615, partial [Rhizobium ruizarguesonis]